jgi:diguanylate cyclase (GGDEF)-like protein
VLLAEHDPVHVRELEDALDGARPPIQVERVDGLAACLERLSRGGVDAVLLDLDLPDSQGLTTFERAAAFAPDVPIVVLSSEEREDLALDSLQGGAQDHLLLERATPDVVVRSVRYAVERHRLLSALRSLSLIDDLTGLYNRRGFDNLGEQSLKLARRNGRDVSLVHLDLDRFKIINDSLGHHVGDRALRRVADILRGTFRQSDVMARVNGDEFLVLALEASGEAAEHLVERVRSSLAEFNESAREPYRLSACVAIARSRGGAPLDLDELLGETGEKILEQKKARRVPSP